MTHWFALDESRPLFAFAGIWRLWTGERKGDTGEHRLFAFLTVQMIDASSERFWKSMRKSLGSKRREIPEVARQEIVRIYAELLNGGAGYGEFSKIFDVSAFGYREIRIERPLRLSFQATPERLEIDDIPMPHG